MRRVGAISTAVLSLLLGTTDLTYGQQERHADRQKQEQRFREGFRRGYEDGYSSRYQHGRSVDGSYSLLDAILSQVLGFQPLH